MNSVSDTFASAVQHHQAGRLHQAEVLYRQILEVEQRRAEAVHLLGVRPDVVVKRGDHTRERLPEAPPVIRLFDRPN